MRFTSWGLYREAPSGRPFFQYSKYHITDDDGKTTLCGLDVPESDYGSLRDDECKRCLKAAEKQGVTLYELRYPDYR